MENTINYQELNQAIKDKMLLGLVDLGFDPGEAWDILGNQELVDVFTPQIMGDESLI